MFAVFHPRDRKKAQVSSYEVPGGDGNADNKPIFCRKNAVNCLRNQAALTAMQAERERGVALM